MKYISTVLRWASFAWYCKIYIVSWMGPNWCVFWSMYGVVGGVSAGLDCISMFFKSLCEAYSVCPTYGLLQSGHVSLYAPDLLYLSRVWGFG